MESHRRVFLKLYDGDQMTVKTHRCLGPRLRASDLVYLGRGLGLGVSNKHPGDVAAAGPAPSCPGASQEKMMSEGWRRGDENCPLSQHRCGWGLLNPT